MKNELLALMWIAALPSFLILYEIYKYIQAQRELLEEELRGMKACYAHRFGESLGKEDSAA